MSKCPRRGKLSGSSERSKVSIKKARTDDSGSKSEPGETLAAPEPVPPPAGTRDSEYYYEDGSIVLLADDTLFKVHASLLKTQSEVIRDMLTPPPGSDEGLTDQFPIKLPDVFASDFRNLLKVFYSLNLYVNPSPSDNAFLGTQAIKDPTQAWETFNILGGIVHLAKRFCMVDIEKWAANQLRSLVKASAAYIAIGARTEMEDMVAIGFIRPFFYAIDTSDTSLVRGIRNLIQYSCTQPANISPKSLTMLLRLPQLHQRDLGIFGFSFITLLNLGHDGWQHKCFTREDRIAFFSAKSYLTPLPESLGQDLTMPLLAKPPYTRAGYLDVFGDEKCSENCQRRLSLAWKSVFNSSYYLDVTSSEAMKPTTQLGRLPYLRMEFSNAVRAHGACKIDCGAKAIESLDADINQLFVRLAGYYQGVE
ncbi:hypothetical protein FRC09_018113 [Ceratobasidium sp. 395]|nr:hypothetical protein FRC09_018113 [Ceratobasidium sp. 395]